MFHQLGADPIGTNDTHRAFAITVNDDARENDLENQSWLRRRIQLFSRRSDGVDAERSSIAARRHVVRSPDPRIAERFGQGLHRCVWQYVQRLVAPAGIIEIRNEFVIMDSGVPDAVARHASQVPLQELPDDALMYLLGSRYCDTQKLTDFAWSMFGQISGGWTRVQAICDYVHDLIRFGYHFARSDRTASEAHEEREGVCRDFAHLAVTLCRCVNIPARYCTGYLGDIGVPRDPAPMDFSAWFEAFVGGRWYTFDARHNQPRIGRVVIARGRDAADVAISTSFGPTQLVRFNVLTEEVSAEDMPALQPNDSSRLRQMRIAQTV